MLRVCFLWCPLVFDLAQGENVIHVGAHWVTVTRALKELRAVGRIIQEERRIILRQCEDTAPLAGGASIKIARVRGSEWPAGAAGRAGQARPSSIGRERKSP